MLMGGEHLQHEDACKIATDYSHCTQNQIRAAAVAICRGGQRLARNEEKGGNFVAKFRAKKLHALN